MIFLFPIAFAILIFWKATLGPIDDHLFLNPSEAQHFIFGDRFYPLDGIEQFFILNHFGLSPTLFYLVNSIELLLLFFVLFKIIQSLVREEGAAIQNKWLLFIVLLTPGVTTAYFRLLAPERLLVLCLSTIVLLDLKTIRGGMRNFFYLVLASISLFLKEPAFLLLGGLSFFRFLEKKDRAFHLLILSLCVSFLLIYLGVTHSASSHYGANHQSKMMLLLKNLFNFSFNDPLVLFFVLPVWGYFFVVQKKLDPYLSLVVGYLFVFLALGLFQEYYLLPILPFLLVSWIRHHDQIRFRPWRWMIIVLVLNASLVGLHQISVDKNEPRGFLETMESLTQTPNIQNKKVCFLGLDEEFSNEILLSSKQFFAFLKPEITPEPQFLSAHSNAEKICDYFINSPYNFEGVEADPHWIVLHHFIPSLSFPPISIRTLIKYFAMKSNQVSLINKNVLKNHDFILFKNQN